MAHLLIPIDGDTCLRIGLESTGRPEAPSDWELVRQAARLIGSWLAQAAAPSALESLPGEVRSERFGLMQSLSPAPANDERLDVYALGTLRAQQGGVLLRNWGGPKAGTRQAEAIFAFLFDRGERGAHKDEVIELIWPDVELERADVAFHRTLGGLRRTLAPSGCPPMGEVISFRNDRYRLNPELVRWSDVHEFEEQLDAACTTSQPEAVRQHLDNARRLYRGDYLDDCPFYGDSSDVEGRRQLFRGRHTDVLIALANAQEQRGDRTAAARFFREALAANGTNCPPAEQGLMRLQGAGLRAAVTGPERDPGDDRRPTHRLRRRRRAIGPQSRRRTGNRESRP